MKNNTALWVVLSLSATLFFFQLGERPFRNPDEGRYAEVAREMVSKGEWVEPQLYGVDYLRKPILFYWLLALSFKCFGFSEYSARFVPALFGVLSVALTFLFVRRLLGARAAITTSLILMTHVWFLQVGRYLLIDMVFSFFVTAAVFSYYLATVEENKRTRFYCLFYLSMGFAFLAKGVAGLVIPALTVLIHTASTRRVWGFFRASRLLTGFAIFCAVIAPWFILISIKEPEFLEFFFLHEHFKRFSSSDFEHQRNWFYYLWVVPAIFLPWTILWPPLKRSFILMRQRTAESGVLIFSVLTSLGIIFFYSLSRTKLPTYILPVIPLLCIVVGNGWCVWIEERSQKKNELGILIPLIGIAILAIGAMVAIPSIFSSSRHSVSPDTISFLRIMAGMVLAGCIAAVRSLKRGRRDIFFYLVAGTLGAASLVLVYILNSVNQNYTTKHFASVLAPKLKEGDLVFIYDHPGPFYDFRFYLGKPVKLVGLAGELELSKEDHSEGGEDDEERASWVTREEFWKLINEGKSLYCLMRKSDFQGLSEEQRSKLSLVSQDRRKILVSSR